MTGSSGPQLGVALLRALSKLPDVETHLIVSEGARITLRLETELSVDEVEDLADVVHSPTNMAASVASGSFVTVGMVVIPCSMKTLGAIANGYADNLVSRAAEVTLKERRKLVVVPRETPLSLLHLRNMVAVTDAGGVVLPPVPGFYHGPRTIDDLLAHTVGKVLDQFGLTHDSFRRWEGE
jgi:polyprenyl P-hydroxybenzoate/phenylacrylic acid decarboxylase-like protein